MRFLLAVAAALLGVAAAHGTFDMDSSYEYIQPSKLLPGGQMSNYEWNSIRERMAQENVGEVPIVTEGKLKVAGGSDKGSMRFKPNGQAVKTPQKPKVDNLPKYCDPPNPCPIGKTANDGCQADVQDTEEFNRDYILRKQQNGECPCDREHMRSCDGRRTVSSGVQLNEPIVQQINSILRNAMQEDDSESESSDSVDDSEQLQAVQIPEDARVVAKKGHGFNEAFESDADDESQSESDDELYDARP